MEFWNNTLTEKSWQTLQQLREKKLKFIVIGGWAAYLWTGLHKSKDIDIVITGFKELDYLKKNYNLAKNDNLKKYEIKIEEVDIDIYVPFFSRLAIPPEDIGNYTALIQNFQVAKPEALLILKQGAEQERESSVKGEKDRIDIIALVLCTGINFSEYIKLLKKYNLEHFYSRLKRIIQNFRKVEYIGMNLRQFKLKKSEIAEKMKRAK